jgi:hypothetical protein
MCEVALATATATMEHYEIKIKKNKIKSKHIVAKDWRVESAKP